MGLFDFLKPKRSGVSPATFNSQQYQREIMAYAQASYFENNHDYNHVKKSLIKEGLSDQQCDIVIENLKRVNAKMVDDFENDLDSGKISGIKFTPNPDHKRGEVSKDQVDRYIGYGAFQMERDELDNALELFDKALELDDRATLAYANKGTLYSKKGDIQKALECYNKALEIEPEHLQILENKLQVHLETEIRENGDKELIETVEKILTLDPSNFGALVIIVQKHAKTQQMNSALAYLKKLFEKHYSDQFVIHLLIETFSEIKDKDQAMVEFDKIEAGLDSWGVYQLNYCKAIHLKYLEAFEEALTLFHELNKIRIFSWNFYQAAIIKNLQGKEEECFEKLRKAFELEPALKEDAKQYSELENLWGNPRFVELTS